MRDKWLNNVHIEGRIFSHTLQSRVTGEASKNPGTPYIRGTINVATDEEGINIVPVSFTYVTEFYGKSGKPNDTYKVLLEIIENDDTWEKNGKDGAPQVRIDGNIDVSDFKGRDGNMVEAKQIRGGFVHYAQGNYGLNSDENKRNTFEADMLIAATVPQEVEDGDDYLNIRGYVFAFNGALIPVTFSVRSKGGIDYFEKCDISNDNPMLTKVWGNITSSTYEVKTETENAFGEARVDVSTRSLRSWDVTGCAPDAYPWDDESTITINEFKNLLDERAQTIAIAKQRAEEYEKSQSGKSGFPAAGTEEKPAEKDTSISGFKF